MSAEDVQTLLSRDRAFTRATATANLNDRQMARMEAALKAENPSDVAAWSAAYIEDLGIVKQVTQPAAPAATATTTEAPRPAAAPAAPSAHTLPTAMGVPDLFSMTPAQHAALGPQGVRSALEQLWKIGNQMSGAPERPKPPQR